MSKGGWILPPALLGLMDYSFIPLLRLYTNLTHYWFTPRINQNLEINYELKHFATFSAVMLHTVWAYSCEEGILMVTLSPLLITTVQQNTGRHLHCDMYDSCQCIRLMSSWSYVREVMHKQAHQYSSFQCLFSWVAVHPAEKTWTDCTLLSSLYSTLKPFGLISDAI